MLGIGAGCAGCAFPAAWCQPPLGGANGTRAAPCLASLGAEMEMVEGFVAKCALRFDSLAL